MSLAEIAGHVHASLAELPYRTQLVLEPGRRLVATCMRLMTEIIGRVERADGSWLFLDCGVYNALYEALIHQGKTQFPVSVLHRDHSSATKPFILTGPTGDGLDVIARNVCLPSDLRVGDQLMFENVGAYTRVFACSFNGFPPPPVKLRDHVVADLVPHIPSAGHSEAVEHLA